MVSEQEKSFQIISFPGVIALRGRSVFFWLLFF